MIDYKPCILIPVYNHDKQLEPVLKDVAAYKLPIIVVDDGSSKNCAAHLKKLKYLYGLELFQLPINQGKGAAVVRGFLEAWRLGYSHVIQLDADGQHDVSRLTDLLTLSKEQLTSLITAIPIYDESVPRSRKIGRYITHFWVWVNTLSFSIKDSMMGFRVYPLAEVIQLLNVQNTVGRRMDFDTDIMVRLFWRGVSVISLPVKVIYPDDGLSHFNLVRDNWRISCMHTALFFGMLKRMPLLLVQKIKR